MKAFNGIRFFSLEKCGKIILHNFYSTKIEKVSKRNDFDDFFFLKNKKSKYQNKLLASHTTNLRLMNEKISIICILDSSDKTNNKMEEIGEIQNDYQKYMSRFSSFFQIYSIAELNDKFFIGGNTTSTCVFSYEKLERIGELRHKFAPRRPNVYALDQSTVIACNGSSSISFFRILNCFWPQKYRNSHFSVFARTMKFSFQHSIKEIKKRNKDSFFAIGSKNGMATLILCKNVASRNRKNIRQQQFKLDFKLVRHGKESFPVAIVQSFGLRFIFYVVIADPKNEKNSLTIFKHSDYCKNNRTVYPMKKITIQTSKKNEKERKGITCISEVPVSDQHVLVGYKSGIIDLIDLKNGNIIRSFKGHSKEIKKIQFDHGIVSRCESVQISLFKKSKNQIFTNIEIFTF